MILLDGQLKVVESNISLDPRRTHAGPDVVWLTTSPRHGQGWASMSPQYSYVDKCRIVIEVDLSDAEPWWPWAERHGSEFIHMRALATSGDENVPRHVRDEVTPEVFRAAAIQRARRQWYVVERPVPWPQWVSITDQVAGTTIWRRTPEQLEAERLIKPKLYDDKGGLLIVDPDNNNRYLARDLGDSEKYVSGQVDPSYKIPGVDVPEEGVN